MQSGDRRAAGKLALAQLAEATSEGFGLDGHGQPVDVVGALVDQPALVARALTQLVQLGDQQRSGAGDGDGRRPRVGWIEGIDRLRRVVDDCRLESGRATGRLRAVGWDLRARKAGHGAPRVVRTNDEAWRALPISGLREYYQAAFKLSRASGVQH